MAVIRPRNDPVRLFWRRIATLSLVIFVFFSLWAVIGVFQKERDSKVMREEAEVRLKEQEKREVALRARIAVLETERGQEAALRDAYGVGREGEGMVQIVDKPASSSVPRAQEERSLLERIFWWW